MISDSRSRRKFLLKQLIRRDFHSRYKKAFLGVLWSMLSPMLVFFSQVIIFSYFFDRGEHYPSYLISGNVVFHYFTDSTSHGMHALSGNAGIISSIRVKKDLFIISKNIACFFNFLLTLFILVAVVLFDGVGVTWKWIWLIYPIACLFVFNLGTGYILSAFQVFFKDTEYFYRVFTRLLIYFSAIFYYVDRFPERMQKLFFINPVYSYINFFRQVIIYGRLPDVFESLLCLLYALLFLIAGKLIYRFNEDKFVYYL